MIFKAYNTVALDIYHLDKVLLDQEGFKQLSLTIGNPHNFGEPLFSYTGLRFNLIVKLHLILTNFSSQHQTALHQYNYTGGDESSTKL